MTDAQMLQNLLAVYEMMVVNRLDFRAPERYVALKEVIAELRRRTARREAARRSDVALEKRT